jgi:hypothetical protein
MCDGDDSWVLNPQARLRMESGGAAPRQIRVLSRRRGQTWRETVIGEHERLFALLLPLVSADDDVAFDVDDDDAAALATVGVLLRPGDVPQEPRFFAPLARHADGARDDNDEDDDGDGGDDDNDGDEPLLVHPSLRHETPAEFAASAACLAPGAPLWLEDARTGVTAPYWPDADVAAVVRAASPGAPAPPADAGLRERLRRDGFLVRAGALARQTAARDEAHANAAALLATHGYALVRALIPAQQLAALQRYYRRRLDGGEVPFGDTQVERRFAEHNEPVARLFLTALTGVVARVAGRAVKPAYAYFASYREGAALEKHLDRAQCEYSISFLVDYEPRPAGPSPWPLHVSREADDDGVALRQHIGDAIIYKGRELYHWRTPLAAGQRSTHIFFHYVPIDFAGALD